MLFDMDQYSRQRVPLYTGHRARALANLSVVEPAHGPTLQTTQVLLQLMCMALHGAVLNIRCSALPLSA